MSLPRLTAHVLELGFDTHFGGKVVEPQDVVVRMEAMPL